MFTLKKTLLFATLCGALTAPSQASNTTEQETTNRTVAVAPLNEGDLATQQAIRAKLQEAINAHPKKELLNSWAAILGPDAPIIHFNWARQMLKSENVARLEKNQLLQQLAEMPDKTKALALGAKAAEIFTNEMRAYHQAPILEDVLASSRPASEIAEIAVACKQHFFMKQMDGALQGDIIQAALNSVRPVSEYAEISAACNVHLLTMRMDQSSQRTVITAALSYSGPLSNMEQIGVTCKSLGATMDGEDLSRVIANTLKSVHLPLTDITLILKIHTLLSQTCGSSPNSKDLIPYIFSLSPEKIGALLEASRTETMPVFRKKFMETWNNRNGRS